MCRCHLSLFVGGDQSCHEPDGVPAPLARIVFLVGVRAVGWVFLRAFKGDQANPRPARGRRELR